MARNIFRFAPHIADLFRENSQPGNFIGGHVGLRGGVAGNSNPQHSPSGLGQSGDFRAFINDRVGICNVPAREAPCACGGSGRQVATGFLEMDHLPGMRL